jgi:hypothetical protein
VERASDAQRDGVGARIARPVGGEARDDAARGEIGNGAFQQLRRERRTKLLAPVRLPPDFFENIRHRLLRPELRRDSRRANSRPPVIQRNFMEIIRS